uniref:Peroxidase n=1 Tax=Populus trichocarpa TaxID=3694 RepID=W8Q457_POPTR|nr:class III peroxidase [Populus trichocarpa]
MEMPRVAAALALALSLIFVNMASQCSGQLQFGFYNGKCKDRNGFQRNVEDIVKQKVKARFSTDTTIVAALLRMQFHDCFVNGCDASILLDVPNGEKTAPPNLSVRGYDFIEEIKTEIENTCPGVVSCADIIVMATRDAVVESRTGWYPVQTGRRDGRVSSAQNVKLPSPSIPIPQAIAAFNSKRLSTIDMVYLLGGHSVGVAHCGLFQNRLYDFKNTGHPDPTMNTTLLKTLQTLCPQNSGSTNSANLDQDPLKSSSVDKSYYEQIRLGNGILEVDQQLALDSNTRFSVARIAESNDFSFQFGRAMIKLGAVDVKIGKDGEIRKRCAAVNSPNGNSGGNIFNIFG